MVNFGPPTAEICWRVWGTPPNQRVSRLGFVTAPTSLNGGQQNSAGCLAVSRAGTLYIHFWGLLSPNRILPGAIFTLRHKSCVLLYWQRYSTAIEQRPPAKLCGVVQEWNYGTVADGATYIRLGGHHVRHRPTF